LARKEKKSEREREREREREARKAKQLTTKTFLPGDDGNGMKSAGIMQA
jgi:hypothetical protein